MSGGLTSLGEVVPMSRAQVLASSAVAGYMFFPVYGLVPSTFSTLAVAYGHADTPAKVLGTMVGLGLAPFFAGRLQVLADLNPVSRKKKRGLRIGPVRCTETDLFTSMLILGATGTGKTSRVLLPAVEDLLNTYNEEDDAIDSKNPYQKCGGYVIEVKGKFFEVMVTLAHRAGRNASTDVRVIRANSTLPVVEFKDEHGRKFFMNGQPCSTGSEVSLLYKPYRFKNGEPVESTLFKRVNLQDLENKEEELRSIEVKVHEDIRFIGWRWRNGRLHRVKQTLKRDDPEFTGEVIVPPKKLHYVKTLHLSNGLRYNLIDPRVPPSEAAERISLLAKMSSGEGKGGNGNEFFYQAAQKVIDCSIRLQRLVAPKTEVTVLEINRLIAHDSALHAALNVLDSIKSSKQEQKNHAEKAGDTDTAYEIGKTITSMDDLQKFFTEEWLKLKATPTGSSIQSTITNLFGAFMRDPQLAETFCSPATFTFDDCSKNGTIFCFVPGSEYEGLARTLGTVLKMDWQGRMLRRVSEGSDSLNKNRVVLHVADECQAFIISGAQDAGDPKFMSLCRESKIINICATQSESWVYAAIPQNEAKVLLQSYGTRVYLTQTDPDTNKRASDLCGVRKREKRTHTQQLHVGDLIRGKEATAKQQLSYEEKPLFEPHDFSQLKNDEAICFNKGDGLLEVGMGDCKAMKSKIPWRWITSESGAAIVADRVRWWFCEVWENDIFKAGRMSLLDPGGPEVFDDPVAPLPVGPDDAAAKAPVEVALAPSPAPTPTPPGAPKPAPSEPPEASAPPAAPKPPPAPPKKSGGAPPSSNSGSRQQTRKDSSPRVPHEPQDILRKAGDHPLGNMIPPGGAAPIDISSIKETPVPPNHGGDTTPHAETPPAGSSDGGQPSSQNKLTPAELARQEKAYRELVERNPFLLVTYEDEAGLGNSVARARQRSEMPAEDLLVASPRGGVAGDKDIVQDASQKAGARSDLFRPPLDLAGDDSDGAEVNRRTVDSLAGRLKAPDAVREASKEIDSHWSGF